MSQIERETGTDGPAESETSFHRQRNRPIRGCMRLIGCGSLIVIALLLLTSGGAYYYLGTDHFARLIKRKIEANLEWRLGREVTIGRVILHRRDLDRVVLQNITIANVAGATRPYLATVREVELNGGLESFWTRTVRIGRVDVRDPRLNVEIFREGSPHPHNFPGWRRGEPRSYQIARVEIDSMLIEGAIVEMLDRRHDFDFLAEGIRSEVTPTFQKQIYEGRATSPRVTLRFKEYEPILLTMNAGYDYHPGVLTLDPASFTGEGIELIAIGKVDPLTQAVYDFRITARTELARIGEIFEIERPLDGRLSFDGRLRGEKGKFDLEGGFAAPTVSADAYELGEVQGTVTASDQAMAVQIESASYGGGSITADYQLSQYAEPYPMSVDLEFDGVSLEALFADWDVANTGLRGGATGTLSYAWEKDDLLGGRGSGEARLAGGAVAFGNARYPMRVSGRTSFGLDAGLIRFGPSTLQTPESTTDFSGALRIEGLIADLDVAIRSRDFSELDRLAYNFAHALDKNDYELLGLGGAGTIRGEVAGPFDRARIRATVDASGFEYGEVLLGDADIELRWTGTEGVLRFEPGVFVLGDGRVVLRGTITLPERGPGPVFDLAAEVTGYPVERILEVAGLDLAITGIGTGTILVQGIPDRGNVTFEDVAIVREGQRIHLQGQLAWMPGEGNVNLDLDLGATAVPIGDLLAFLEIDDIPVTGRLTGTLHLEGPKSSLEGAGSVTIREGTIFGEPIDVATADLEFHEGVMTARSIEIQSAAGTIRGEASVDLNQETFSYTIEPTELDLAGIGLLADFSELFGGRLRINSTGAGTFDQPDLLIEAVLVDGTVRGRAIPIEGEAPRLYLAIRSGQLRIIGSGWDAFQIEGMGTVAENGEVDGDVEIRISDVRKAFSLLAPQSDIDASGSAVIHLELGGSISDLNALRVDGTVAEMSLRMTDHELVPLEPIRFSLADGEVRIQSLRLQTNGSQFSLFGGVGLSGERRIDLRVEGLVEAALLQLFIPETRVEGHVNVAASIGGTIDSPRINGTAEIQGAEIRAPGFPQVISDITGTFVFTGDRLEIDSLTATVGGGRVVAGGFVALEGLTPTRFRVGVQGTDVSLRYFEGITLDGDFDLVLAGDAAQSLLQGQVIVDRALYYRDFDLTTTFLNLFLEPRVVSPEVSASWQDQVSMDVDVIARDAIAVRNNIADVTASAELEVSGTLANPIILGVVIVDEGGTIEFQDVEYEVVRGTINFQNPFRLDPFFDITAEGRHGEYNLTVNLTGTLDRITPTITSDPPTSDLTLLSLISPQLSDPSTTDPTRMDLENLGQAGGSLLIQAFGDLIGSRIFPFADSFRFDTGALAGVSEPRVTFEKRVDEDLRVIVVYFLNSENDNIQIVEWQVTPDWMLQFVQDSRERSDFLIDSIDARFRRRYRGHWLARDRSDQSVIVAADDQIASETPVAPAATPAFDAVVPLTRTAETPRIASIEYLAESAVNRERLGEITADLQIGEPLSLRDLQSAIKGLFGTGEFGDVRVDAAPVGEGSVALRFLLFLNYRIATIEFEGLPLNRNRVENALAIAPGDTLSLNAVDRSATAVVAELQRRGWIEATVDPEVEFERARNRASVTLHVTPGPTAMVGAIDFEGSLDPFTPSQLQSRMRTRPGDVFTSVAARADAERIQSFLVEQGHRRASVRYLERTYDTETNQVQLRYRIETGPQVRVEVEGVDRRDVRRLLPFRADDEAYSEDLIERARDEIRRRYQSRGHYFVDIEIDEELVDEVWVVTFEIDPGERFELARVEFDGNQQLEDDSLRDAIATAPAGGIRTFLRNLFRRPGGVTDEMIDADVDNLESLYRLEGFTVAEVGSPDVTAIEPGQLEVSFPVTEGPRSIVTEVRIEGAERFEANELPDPTLQVGDPLNPRLVYADVVALKSFYGEQGNVEVEVKTLFEFGDDRTSVGVIYRIAEGPPVDVDQVIVRGNTYTETEVIQRQAGLESGEPFSYRSLLEAQRELYRLGIFQRVEVIPDDAGAGVANRNIILDVEEGDALTVGGSVGYSDEQGAGGSVSLSHRNLFGTARFIGFDARYFQREQRYLLTYREPFIFDYDIPLQVTFFQNHEEREMREFDRLGTVIEASRIQGETLRWATRYEYRRVDCIDSTGAEVCAAPDVPRDEREISVSSVTPTVFWDRRDDPINPFEGIYASASLEYAFPLFAAETTFLKGFAQSAWYRPLSSRSTLAISARIGLTERLASNGPASVVPFPERFTAGGESSHRAFEVDRLGILCEDDDLDCEPTLVQTESGIFPLGGNALLLTSAEYRFPIFGSLQGAAFVDVGQVWRNIETIDLGQVRYGAGTGLRYLTPLGPIRFDIGWNLDREPWEEPFATFLTIGFSY